MSNAKEVIVAIDEDGCERIYVDGVLQKLDGETVFAIDIIEAAGGSPVTIHQRQIDRAVHVWPEHLVDIANDED